MTLTTVDSTPALVVIDLQKGIVTAHSDDGTTAAVTQAARLAAEFRRHDLPVVLVNVTGRAPGRTDHSRPVPRTARSGGPGDRRHPPTGPTSSTNSMCDRPIT